MVFSARIFGNKCRALMAAAKSTPAPTAAKSTPAPAAAKSTRPPAAAKSTPPPATSKSTAAADAAQSTVDTSAAEPKAPPRGTGILKVQTVSPALAKFLGSSEASRSDAVKEIWAYVKSRNLQNPKNKREIYCDDKLKAIFDGNDKVNFQSVAKLLSNHFPKTA